MKLNIWDTLLLFMVVTKTEKGIRHSCNATPLYQRNKLHRAISIIQYYVDN